MRAILLVALSLPLLAGISHRVWKGGMDSTCLCLLFPQPKLGSLWERAWLNEQVLLLEGM